MKLRDLRLWMLFCMAALATTVSAQDTVRSYTLKGCVVDSVTLEPEPYATVTITYPNAQTGAVKRFLTREDGTFSQPLKTTGQVTLTVTATGRQPVVRQFTSPADRTVLTLDTLYISDAANLLEGVEIVAQAPLVKAGLDKIEYNIADDPDSKTNSVIEMLRKVPLVTVDGEDNITVNGSSSFKVYVNGKPNNMMSNNPKEVLRSMPASSIKKIEVITNPGAKYDAEGSGGILNIVTEGGGMQGYTVTLSGNVGTTNAGGGIFGTVQQGKLTVSARYNYRRNYSPESRSTSSMTTLADISETSSDTESSSTNSTRGHFQYGSMEASYEIDTLRLVTASFGLWGGGRNGDGHGSMLASSPLDGSRLYWYDQRSNSHSSWYSIDGGIDYQRLFHTKERMLTLSYKIDTNPQNSDSYIDYDQMGAAAGWDVMLQRFYNQHNDGQQHTTEHTFQIDYTTPFGPLHSIETGLKYILRNNSSENDRYQQTAPGSDQYDFDSDYSSHYKHRNHILAAYAGYALKLKKWSARLGLRYEHTIQDVEYLLGRGTDFTSHFNDVVPSVSLGYQLSELSNLRLSYNMRIYRPGIWYLNPYLDDSNPTSISQGNPELSSEKSHRFALNYSNFSTKFNLNASLSYSFTNNSIEPVSSYISDTEIAGVLNPTGKQVLYETYRNIGHSRQLSLNLYGSYNFTPQTRLYLTGQASYVHMDDGNQLRNHGFQGYAYGQLQQSFSGDWRVSFYGQGMTPWLYLQGKSSTFFYYGLSISKSFLDKRLSLTASANNFLKKYRSSQSSLEASNFLQQSWSRYCQQNFAISISYRIGELKASVKKAQRTISNDDVKSGGESGGGGE